MRKLRIDVSGLSVKALTEIGEHLKGEWHIEREPDQKDKTKDKVFLVKDDLILRGEAITEVI